jgi:hypothetical protein
MAELKAEADKLGKPVLEGEHLPFEYLLEVNKIMMKFCT